MSDIQPEIFRAKAEEYRDQTAKKLSELVKIPSISGREEMVAHFLENELCHNGACDVQIDNFGNVIARIGSKGPVIAFDAHIDTVDIGQRDLWTSDPFSGEIKQDRVFGRGTVDQKAGMASMMTALKIISQTSSDLPFTLFFIGSVLEEDCDGLCWQYIVNEDKIVPDIVVLTEPTDGKINRGQRGRMEMEIAVTGISCHGSAPERGSNAIYKMAPIITAIEKLNDTLPMDPFLGKGTVAATRLRSNSPSLNAVADMAAIYIDRRLTAGETPESALAEIEALTEVQTTSACVTIPIYEDPTWRGITYPTRKTYPAWTLDENHHLIEYAGRCHRRLFGKEAVIGKWTFSTNGVATKGLLNIPTFGYGPGEEKMAHAPNESIAIDDLVRCAAFYAYFPWIIVGM